MSFIKEKMETLALSNLPETKTRIVVISGFSGAGKTVALRALEDVGYFCIDNFPPQLINHFINLSAAGGGIKKIAIGVDVREKSFLDGIEDTINSLRNDCYVEVIFLEAENPVLIRRYKETRRPHPLLQNSVGDINSSLELEAEYLSPIKNIADRILDSSSYTPHQLRTLIMETFGGDIKSTLSITFISFGYKYGLPHQVDILFDIRFLPNPFFINDLKDLTGLDEPVKHFVLNNSSANKLLDKLKDLFKFLIPEYIHEGKSSLIIGIGCTGGKHRSPVIAEELKKYFSSTFGLEVGVIHREL